MQTCREREWVRAQGSCGFWWSFLWYFDCRNKTHVVINLCGFSNLTPWTKLCQQHVAHIHKTPNWILCHLKCETRNWIWLHLKWETSNWVLHHLKCETPNWILHHLKCKTPQLDLISFEVRNIQLDFMSFEMLNTQLHLTLIHITEMTCLIPPSYLE
jgi:hypothetical protein